MQLATSVANTRLSVNAVLWRRALTRLSANVVSRLTTLSINARVLQIAASLYVTSIMPDECFCIH